MHLRNSPSVHLDLSQRPLASLGRILLTIVSLRCLIPALFKRKMDKLRLSRLAMTKQAAANLPGKSGVFWRNPTKQTAILIGVQ